MKTSNEKFELEAGSKKSFIVNEVKGISLLDIRIGVKLIQEKQKETKDKEEKKEISKAESVWVNADMSEQKKQKFLRLMGVKNFEEKSKV